MKNKEEWMELCERAAFEQDSANLLGLVRKIKRPPGRKAEAARSNLALGQPEESDD
jgi:hypothetical protein